MAARKYRVAYLIDGLSMGGAERLMVPVLKHLSRQDFEPYVCAMQSKDGNPLADEIRALGIRVDCLGVRYLRDLDALPRLTTYLKHTGADLVHTQLEIANILGNISAKLLRLPSVCTIHVLPSRQVKPKTRLHQKAEWFVLRHFCDRVISVAEEARRHHLEVSGASADQVITIHNGIDLSPFSSIDSERTRAAVREELGIPPQVSVLTTVAVLRPPKGLGFMIRALPAIITSGAHPLYLIVGDGPHRQSLEEEVQRAGVADRVIFAGMRTDIPRLLAASDIFVLPSLTEALPTVLAEAMAARLPVVASRVGGIPEMITPGVNGLLVEPEDVDGLANACIQLLGDPVMRARLGERGGEIVQRNFNIFQQVDELEQLYFQQLEAYGK